MRYFVILPSFFGHQGSSSINRIVFLCGLSLPSSTPRGEASWVAFASDENISNINGRTHLKGNGPLAFFATDLVDSKFEVLMVT
jgi:hypothetical protein